MALRSVSGSTLEVLTTNAATIDVRAPGDHPGAGSQVTERVVLYMGAQTGHRVQRFHDALEGIPFGHDDRVPAVARVGRHGHLLGFRVDLDYAAGIPVVDEAGEAVTYRDSLAAHQNRHSVARKRGGELKRR